MSLVSVRSRLSSVRRVRRAPFLFVCLRRLGSVRHVVRPLRIDGPACPCGVCFFVMGSLKKKKKRTSGVLPSDFPPFLGRLSPALEVLSSCGSAASLFFPLALPYIYGGINLCSEIGYLMLRVLAVCICFFSSLHICGGLSTYSGIRFPGSMYIWGVDFVFLIWWSSCLWRNLCVVISAY